MKKIMTAGLVTAALGVAPAWATAQEPSGTAGTAQTEPQTTEPGTTGTTGDTQEGAGQAQPGQQQAGQQQAGQQQQGGGGADQEAVRQHLAAARQSLAELTQLPAAGQLDGDQRQRISEFISHFNEFATATTDWRERYERVDQSLDRILDEAEEAPGTAAAAPAPAPGADPAAADAAAGTTGADGFDPTIIAKLRETREHLDAFELATGDPGFIADRIARIIDNAQTGDTTVGTSGAEDRVQGSGVSATGMVTLSQSQVEDIRRHLERLRRR